MARAAYELLRSFVAQKAGLLRMTTRREEGLWREVENVEGVQFIVDSEGKKSSVVINLKKHGRLWEDIYDNWLAKKRKDEPRETFECVRARLKRQGKLSA